MANMSYCRFQNTVKDLRDCEEALLNIEESCDLDDLHQDELRALKQLLKVCNRIVSEGYEEMINDYEESQNEIKC